MPIPQDLKADSLELYEEQKSFEKSSQFKNYKRKYKDLNLESKYDLNALSEIFQDPDLLARVSTESFLLMKARERESRVRSQFELVTTKRPQAKDVERIRVLPDEDFERIKKVEENIKEEDKYVNPIGFKKRRYLAQEGSEQDHYPMINFDPDSAIMRLLREVQEDSGAPRANNVESLLEVLEGDTLMNDYVEQITVDNVDQCSEISATITEKQASQIDNTSQTVNFASDLVLPTQSTSDSTSAILTSKEEEHPLEKAFKETAALVKESPLKTVGSRYLYTLLPRQCEPTAYKYVKEDYTPQDITNFSELDPTNDTLIVITVFNPANTNRKFQEIEILGSQKLSEFRDSLYCLSDFMAYGDRKDRVPTGEIVNTYVRKLSPSFIYIDHVFYVDTRLNGISSEYYNDIIENWLAKKGVNRSAFQYSVKNMQDVKLEDISFQLNKPYVFMHQDRCEHMLLIQDLRILSPAEYKSKSDFPRTTRNLKYDRFKCSMCSIFPATKVTEEYITTGFSPCYFCDNCFASFHNENDTVTVKEYCGTAGGDLKRHTY